MILSIDIRRMRREDHTFTTPPVTGFCPSHRSCMRLLSIVCEWTFIAKRRKSRPEGMPCAVATDAVFPRPHSESHSSPEPGHPTPDGMNSPTGSRVFSLSQGLFFLSILLPEIPGCRGTAKNILSPGRHDTALGKERHETLDVLGNRLHELVCYGLIGEAFIDIIQKTTTE